MNKSMVNPILKKDLKVVSRSMKFSWGLFAYEAVLALIFFITMMVADLISSYGNVRNNTDIYESYVAFFPVIGIAQLIIVALIIPIMTASSISGEKERKTMDVLLTTTISEEAIIIGKIISAVVRVMMFIIASIPLMAVSFIVGGLSWLTLFEYLILTFLFACYAGSIGTLCSAICKKSITAIILSYVIYFGIYGVLYVPYVIISLLRSNVDHYVSLLLQLFNPVTTFIVFFIKCMTSEDANELFFSGTNGFWEWLFTSGTWIIISCVCQMIVTFVFIKLAANKIKPGNK